MSKALLKAITSLEFRNWLRISCGRHPIEYRSRWPEIEYLDLKKGDVVLDVGANVGDFVECILAYQPWSVIHAFEPLPHAFDLLEKKFTRNADVQLIKKAVGSVPGNLTIQVSSFSEASSFLPQTAVLQDGLYGIDFTVARELDVPVITLDDYIFQKNIRRIKLLKIDTQGYEIEVLKGAREHFSSIDYVYLEGAFQPLYKNQPLVNDLQKYLQATGFLLERMCAFRVDANGDLLECDMLFRNKEASRI